MAWYHVTYSCDHEGSVQVFGKVSNRDWQVRAEERKLCPDCFQKKREEANKKIAQEAQAKGFPELQGSEKQVAWAESIRKRILDEFEYQLSMMDEKYWTDFIEQHTERWPALQGVTLEDLHTIKDIVSAKRSARYFIDNRDKQTLAYVLLEIPNLAKKDEEDDILAQEAKAESTVYPETRVSEHVAEISVSDTEVTVTYERNEEFRNVVKGLGYSWSYDESRWVRVISEMTGCAEERAAELGNELLNNGFPICIFDEDIRKRAITGDFSPEPERWIYAYEKNLMISWEGYDDELYGAAKSLPGASWVSRRGMEVSIAHYQLIEEFADLYGFRLTRKARGLISDHKYLLKKSSVVKPSKAKNEPTTKDGLKEILNQGDAIIDDLLDD